MKNPNYKVVVLDCPYDTWSDGITQKLFSSIIDLKLAGYKSYYSDGVLPMDTYDFIATHILVCEEEEGELRPLTGFKSVTSVRCNRFSLPFTASHILSLSNVPQHAEMLASLMKNCDESGNLLAYDSQWTVLPEIKKSRSIHYTLQELFIANVVHWHTAPSAHHELVGLGACRVRTDKFFERVGFRRLAKEGKPLPTFGYESPTGTEVALIHLDRFSEFATKLAEKYQPLWDDRITIAA